MRNPDQRRLPLPIKLTEAERDFFLELRRLIDIAGFTCRALEELTASPKSGADDPYFYSKSQWGRWLNAQAMPPRKAVRRLAEILATEDIAAERLLDLWSRIFMTADSTGPGQDDDQPARPQVPAAVTQFRDRADGSRAGTPELARPLRLDLLADTAVFTRNSDEFTASPPGLLIGRDSELAMLAELVEGAAAGRGGAVLIEGEPGIGKSALVRAALAQAAGLGCQVFWGTGDELGQTLPLQPLLDGLRVREPSENPRRNVIVQLLRGEIAAERGTDGSAVLAEQLLVLIAEQCAAQPTILIVDDLQWADQASIRLWGRLARSVRQQPLLLVGMMRPVPQRDDLLALRRLVGDAARVQLAGLTEAAAADLIAALTGGQPDGSLRRLAEGAAGNPLYITELVAALMRSSTVTITGAGLATLAAGSAPSSLSAAIAERLAFVSSPAREVLRAAALLGVDLA